MPPRGASWPVRRATSRPSKCSTRWSSTLRADVYALAGTIYNVTTGHSFFDDIENPRDRILAHMRRDPFEDLERLRGYPAAVAKLMRAATALDAADRPWPLEFGREFAAAL